jgi:hypothetical protein
MSPDPKDQDPLAIKRLAFDRQKAKSETVLARDRLAFETAQAANELDLEKRKSRRDLALRRQEAKLKEREYRRAPWVSAGFLTLIGAVITAGGTFIVKNTEIAANYRLDDLKYQRTRWDRIYEQEKAERAVASDIMKNSDLDKGLEKLRTMRDLGLYHDRGELAAVSEARKRAASPANVTPQPAKPAPASASSASAPASASSASSQAAPATIYPRSVQFEATSNKVPTYRECITPRPDYHFDNWRISKAVNGDGDAWFESQAKDRLCVRADASVTAGGANSGVKAELTVNEVPDK